MNYSHSLSLRKFIFVHQAAETARDRKKKISSSADALRFEKTLELAQRQLKETNNIANAEQRQEAVRQQIYNNNLDDIDTNAEVNIPLTDTTRKLSQVSQSLGEDNVIKKDSPKSPTKRVPNKPDSPVKTPPPPPAKPPRTYDHNSPDGKTGDIMIVKSPVVVEQIAGVAESVCAPLPGPCLSTFAAADQQTSPVRSGPKPPMSLATSTPKNASHVSFSNTVTEIPDAAMSPASSSSSDSSGSTSTKPKKIPPPPPPRKSNRNPTTVTTQPTARAPSPPAYENLDKLKQMTEEKRAESPKGFRPLSKYQKELASGIYSNMNRPDLQDQKVQPDTIVRSPEHTAKHRVPELVKGADVSDSDSSISAEIVQISGTVRRRTPSSSKENSPSPSVNSNNGAKDVKKVPPPPPVRKTSALTDGKLNGKEDVVKIGNGDVVNIGNGDVKKLSASQPVDTRSLSPASLKRYEETEIY